ncbi:DUF2470 domain-containing protein [Micromonosporaceae bacterium DT194]|uniref:DUF2470 domain-containing protein n=1 Tax=Melissospora conviva TaxID=3388432 RepID=UPI003C20ACDC
MPFHHAGRPVQLASAAFSSETITEAPATSAPAVATGPAAVTVRSVLSATASLRLRLGDAAVDLLEAHTVLPDGTLVLAVDAMSRLGGLLVAARGVPGAVRLDVTQLAPVAVRSRVRARAWVSGTVRRFDPASLDTCDNGAVLALLDLPPVALWAVDPTEIGLIRDGEQATVSVSDYRAARPDPLAGVEAAQLQHLAQRHGDVLEQLATLADPAVTSGPARVVPVAVDADAMVLRIESADGHSDLRLPFAHRVTGHAGFVQELRMLLATAAQCARGGRDAAPFSGAGCDLPAEACGIPPVPVRATPES